MTDIVERLRAPMWRLEPTDIQACAAEAAAEIERLREALHEIAGCAISGSIFEELALAALNAKSPGNGPHD